MTYFVQLGTESKVRLHLLRKAKEAEHWKANNGIDRIEIDASDLEGDPLIVSLVEHFQCKAHRRLSLFRFLPWTCHSWHVDLQRYAAINMLLEGWDSATLFGTRATGVNLTNLQLLEYEPDRYYLLNSKCTHTIINYSRPRFLLSIGIPEQYSFKDVQDYIERTGA